MSSELKKKVDEALQNAVENGYLEVYTRDPKEIAEELVDQAGLLGELPLDIEVFRSKVDMVAKLVAEWASEQHLS